MSNEQNHGEVGIVIPIAVELRTLRTEIYDLKRCQIDFIRLMEDEEYEIDWHLRILKKKMLMCRELGSEAWTCYHSKTPSVRKRYKKLVERYL